MSVTLEQAKAITEKYEAAQERYALEKFNMTSLDNVMPSSIEAAYTEFNDYVKYYFPAIFEEYVAAELLVGRDALLSEFFPGYTPTIKSDKSGIR